MKYELASGYGQMGIERTLFMNSDSSIVLIASDTASPRTSPRFLRSSAAALSFGFSRIDVVSCRENA